MPPPAAPPPPRAPSPAADFDEGMKLSGSGVLGTINEDQVGALMQMHWAEIKRCKEGAQPKPPKYVGGRIQLRYRIAVTGDVKKVVVEDSSLGNWAIERCVLEIARTLHFSRPKGGEAEFTFPIDFPSRGQVVEWGADKVSADFGKHRKELGECSDGVARQPPYKLTFYLGPGGRVTSAGASSSEPMGDAYITCVLGKIGGWKFTDPLGVVVRASYSIP